MDQLAPHIEYLLQRHDCVILPGMGAFIAVSSPARFDMAEARIIPPSRTVCFNGSIRNDDGVLANSYRRRHKTTFDEGRRMMLADIAAMREALEADGEVAFGRIGTLRLTADSTMEFQPRLSAERIMEEMGMPSIPTCRDTADTAETPDTPAVAPAAQSEEEEMPSASAPEPTGRRFNPANYYIAINRKFAQAAAGLILVVTVALTFMIPGPQRNQATQTASVLPISTCSLTSERQVQAPESAEQATEQPEDPAHYLIVGTFRTPEEAERFIAGHTADGYTLELLEGRTVSRVSAASAATTAPLYRLMRTEDFRKAHPQAWIWTRD